ncbi:MAG TPA: inositol monophosphatase family protein [Polyangiaceae bacterium]|jgi:myo-inositol-1(or 4)-monophosphatase
MFQPSAELKAMTAAARRAGRGLMHRFRNRAELVVELKGPADFVSAADRESEDTLRSALLRRFPRYGFLTEESAPTVGADVRGARFVVDPLDGTTNFLHGIPHFAVAVALEREGRVVAGLVFDPAKDEMFVAELGKGAWLGRERLRVSDEKDLSRALVGTGIPHANSRARHARYLAMLGAVMREAAGIRRYAAAALDLAYVAAGRFAVFFELGLQRWDVAAGSLLVDEAGGRVSEPDGGDGFLVSGSVLATNGRLHPRTLAMLRRATRRAASPPPRRRTRPRG